MQPDTVLSPAPPSPSFTVDATTNRLTNTGFTYDASGNMTYDGANTLVYDGENKVASNNNQGYGLYAYAYDGNGLRVKKTPPSGAATVYIFSGGKVIATILSDDLRR
ncbi:MAG: hypothetical protein ABSF92_03050 [Candidatus Acidiferrales bacterium]